MSKNRGSNNGGSTVIMNLTESEYRLLYALVNYSGIPGVKLQIEPKVPMNTKHYAALTNPLFNALVEGTTGFKV